MARDIQTKSGDIEFLGGDLYVGYSDEQHINDIIIASKGHYKQHPLIGVGIADFLSSPNALGNRRVLEREISLQLESDNATDVKVDYNIDGKLNIEANYDE